MPGALNFDPKQMALSLGGKTAHGFMDGTFITIKRNEDAWSLKVGVDGEAARSKNNNRSGTVEFVLQQSSSFNDVMSGFAQADQQSGAGAVPLFLRDGSGRTTATALTAWVKKFPDAPFGKEIEGRSWIVETDDLEIFLGGN